MVLQFCLKSPQRTVILPLNQNHSFFINEQFSFYGLGQFFLFLNMLKIKICDILPTQLCQIFYVLQKNMKMYQKINKNLKNVCGKISYFCLNSKLDWASLTVVLT